MDGDKHRIFGLKEPSFLMGAVLGGLVIFCAPNAFSFGPVFQSSVPVSASVSSLPSNTTMFGINFSPYMDGQNPNLRSPISESQIRERMELIAPHTEWVRTFSMVDGLEKAGAIAHSLGLKVALGAWIGPVRNPAVAAMNQLNIDNLIAAGQRGEADLLIVGSEALHRRDVNESQLVSYVNDVKAAVPGIPVAVADIDQKLLEAPNLMIAADALFINIYPFWEGTRLDWSLYNVLARYRRMVAAMPGKPIYLSETG